MISISSAATTLVLASTAIHPLTDIFVDLADANCATGNGTAANPVCSIDAAIAIAAPGDTIRIAPGNYIENLTLGVDLNLVGTAGAGSTTISGTGVYYTPSIITIPSNVSASIDGVTITNSYAPMGGAINLAGSLVLTNSTLSGNQALGGGGAISASTPGASLTIDSCLLEDNRIPFGADGGAIRMTQGSCTITNSILRDNEAESGGAISFSGSNPAAHVLRISNSTLSNNRGIASAGGAQGGGISQTGGRLILEDSAITGNFVSYGRGGGLSIANAQFEIRNSTITFNGAGNTGIIGSAPGGGIYLLSNANGLISNSTITRNTAGLSDGGGVSSLFTAGTISVSNTIIADNIGNSTYNPLGSVDLIGTFTSLGYNLIGDGGVGFTNGVNGDIVGTVAAPIDPELAPLDNNGATTQTRALLPGSPALNAGNPLTFEPFDQRGIPRPQGERPEIGAYESVVSTNLDALCNGDGGDGMGCTPCPCGNDRPAGSTGGCLNSTGLGGRLVRNGTYSVAGGNLRIEARDLPASTVAILLSGAALAPTNPLNPCASQGSGFQASNLDGLNCIVQNIQRHGVRPANAAGEIGVTTNGWGTPDPFLGLASFTAGQTRFFQIIYRDDPLVSCQTGLNTTQSTSVTFTP